MSSPGTLRIHRSTRWAALCLVCALGSGCRGGDRSPPPVREPAAAPTPPAPAVDPSAPAVDPPAQPKQAPAADSPAAADPADPTAATPGDPAAANPAGTAAGAGPGDGPDLVAAAVALADSATQPPDVKPYDPPPGESPDALNEGTPEQLLALDGANKALARGDRVAALGGFIEAFDGPPTGAAISAGLAAAELHEAEGRADEAAAIYSRLLQMAPEMAEVHFTAGRFYSAQGKPKQAIAELERTIALQADFLPAYPMLGGVLAATGKKTRAAELMLTYETRLKGLLDRLVDPALGAHHKVPIIDVFALIEDDRATRALITAVGDPSMHVRLAAADALTHDADPAALEAIARAALGERDPVARQALAASLKRAKARFEASTAQPTPRMPAPGR